MITLIVSIALLIAFIAFALLFIYKSGQNNKDFDREAEKWLKIKQEEFKKYNKMDINETEFKAKQWAADRIYKQGYRDGINCSQNWIPIEIKEPILNAQLIFKKESEFEIEYCTDNLYSGVKRATFIRTFKPTHWRVIDL